MTVGFSLQLLVELQSQKSIHKIGIYDDGLYCEIDRLTH